MEAFCKVNYYTYPNFDHAGSNDLYICELEMINNISGNTTWKLYKAKDRKSVIRIARIQAAKFRNTLARFYGNQ